MDLPVHDTRVGLIVNRYQFRCRACRRIFYQPLPELDERRRATRRLVAYVQQECLYRAFTSVAEEVGLHEKTIRNIFKEYRAALDLARPPAAPEWLGIDEIYLKEPSIPKKGISARKRQVRTESKKRYVCVLTDLKHHTILDMFEREPLDPKTGRRWAPTRTVAEYLLGLPNRRQVKVVCMDMYWPYRYAVRKVLPQAAIVVDKYHVLSAVNDAMHGVRKRFKQRLRLNDSDMGLMSKRLSKLTVREKKRLEEWKAVAPMLYEAYLIKEMFYEMWAIRDRRRVEREFRAWRRAIPSTLQKDFGKVLTDFRLWGNSIFNYFDYPEVSNGYTEGANSLIRQTNWTGRGYTLESIRAKMVHHKGDLRVRRSGFQKRGQYAKVESIDDFSPFDFVDSDECFGPAEP